MIDLDRIDEYCRKATEEPWESDYEYPADGLVSVPLRDRYFAGDDFYNDWQIIRTDGGYYPPKEADMTFIAQARTDLPAVVAELREAMELLERLCDGLSAGHGWGEAYEEACEFLEVTE